MDSDIRILLEYRTEDLAGPTPDQFAQFIIRELVGTANELADALVVLRIDIKPAQTTLFRQPGDRPHAAGDVRPRRVILPRNIPSRRMKRAEEALLHRTVLRQLAKRRDQMLKGLPRPGGIVHEEPIAEIRRDPVPHNRHLETDTDAIQGRLVKGVNDLEQFFRPRTVELPRERHKLTARPH